MRFTSNDLRFCILHSCVDGLRSDRLVYYIYAYQKAGLDLKYRYRVQAHGLSCSEITAELNSLINQNKIACSKGVLSLTSEGLLYYDNIILTLKEWGIVDGVKRLFDELTRDELFFVCVTDIVVFDLLKRSGADGLRSGREMVEGVVQNLSSEYSEDNFNTALSIMRQIEDGVMVW